MIFLKNYLKNIVYIKMSHTQLKNISKKYDIQSC